MSTFLVSINTYSEAFHPDPVPELRRLLEVVLEKLDTYPASAEGVLRDSDGKSVGVWGFEPDLDRLQEHDESNHG